jgi:hypothetical protein
MATIGSVVAEGRLALFKLPEWGGTPNGPSVVGDAGVVGMGENHRGTS